MYDNFFLYKEFMYENDMNDIFDKPDDGAINKQFIQFVILWTPKTHLCNNRYIAP